MHMSRKGSSAPAQSNRKRLFLSFFEGLGSAGVFVSGAMPGPKVSHTSIATDWRAVGNDIRRATVAYGQKRDS